MNMQAKEREKKKNRKYNTVIKYYIQFQIGYKDSLCARKSAQ